MSKSYNRLMAYAKYDEKSVIQMYSKKVLDLIVYPENVGKIENADGTGLAGDPECGDHLEITLRVKNQIIQDVKFRVQGCGGAIASSSMTTILAKGKPVMEAYLITKEDIVTALGGLPSEKIHCSVLGEQALKKAILDYAKKYNTHSTLKKE